MVGRIVMFVAVATLVTLFLSVFVFTN